VILTRKKVVFIGLVWPESKSSAAGARIMQLISLFEKNNFEIYFLSSAQNSEFSDDLSRFHCFQIELNSDSFENLISEISPEIAVFDRFVTEEQFSWRIKKNLPDVLTILDTEDLHFLRFARQNAAKENRVVTDDDIYSEQAKREIASILRCDLSLIISEYEIKLLEEKFIISHCQLMFLPFLLDEFSMENPSFSERKDVFFIGNFHHEPNIDAVRYLKTEIWPLIRLLNPKISISIYGAYMPNKILQLNNERENFIVKGRIEDVSQAFKSHKVLLAPLRFGAGQKGKLLEAMMFGVPSVTSSIGAEGMNFGLPWNGIVTDNPHEIASSLVKLLENQNEWEEAVANGYEIINSHFKRSNYESKFFQKIEEIGNNLKKHRQINFIGQILNHNTVNSVKYMSKWIEEKNKYKNEEL
jgi:glycosyltransferase involved in cell wall biosynthesis